HWKSVNRACGLRLTAAIARSSASPCVAARLAALRLFTHSPLEPSVAATVRGESLGPQVHAMQMVYPDELDRPGTSHLPRHGRFRLLDRASGAKRIARCAGTAHTRQKGVRTCHADRVVGALLAFDRCQGARWRGLLMCDGG